WDYYFAVVWQETCTTQIDIYYIDGTTTVTGRLAALVAPTPPAGILNPNAGGGDCYDPDIAATQDYQIPGIGPEEFYYHVNWVYLDKRGDPWVYLIVTKYVCAPVPGPGALSFVSFTTAAGPIGTVLDRPTIASKLMIRFPVGPTTIFETWMCWEDTSNPASVPDIWYRVGQFDAGPRTFAYLIGPSPVPYVPALSSDFNPELWNRNDAIRLFPPFTHLVFDQGIPVGAVPEVVYIDP
ncbi:MAG: hypothetical protein KAJ51_04325, partial [Thermoplasmata archaeon]|nr:hypothetical protein [Thermoplasmata archaeon]